jgi:hypothetical protein
VSLQQGFINIVSPNLFMNIIYNVDVIDNAIAPGMLKKVYDYVRNLTWHQHLLHMPKHMTEYVPAQDPYAWANDTRKFINSIGAGMHRCALSSDEGTLKRDYFLIYLLWNNINRALGSKYEIAGVPEGMFDPTPPPDPLDTKLKAGWRVYLNATHSPTVWNSMGYIHRDNSNLEDEGSVTILCVLNDEWYPSWAGEFMIFPEDPEGATGDHQQFHAEWQQRKNFNIGWADRGRMISPVPGRLIVYDGRCLHKTLPMQCNIGGKDDPSIRVVFRARLKNN